MDGSVGNRPFQPDYRLVVRQDEVSCGPYLVERILERHPDSNLDAFHMKIQLWFSGTVVGYLLAHLLPTRPDPCFSYIAEHTHETLLELAEIFCDSRGDAWRVQHPALASTRCSSQGGFLHISQVELRKAHRGRDLGLYLIHHALSFVKKRWTLAVMSPLPSSPVYWAQDKAIPDFPASVQAGEIPTTQEREEIERINYDIKVATVKLMRHVARMGFLQASERHFDAWFLTSDRYFQEMQNPQHWTLKDKAKDIQVFYPRDWKL